MKTSFIIVATCVCLTTSAELLSPVVQTKTGPVRGKLIQLLPTGRQDVYEFTGIPFAEPPVGERRFKKPAPKQNWTEVLNATKPTKSCLQMDLGKMFTVFSSNVTSQRDNGVVESEDCLYLNIWVPKSVLDNAANRTKQLSVYVFIHGGAFVAGNSMQYNASTISSFDNIVVASIQYRLGSLGFAYFGKNDDAPGNAGLWDQLEALKWISENIASFGGNSSEVTIGGESAGAASVSLHLLSPHSGKYFQRAIVESGTALSKWAVHSPDVAMTITNIVANQSLCQQSSTDATLRCLRALDANLFPKLDMAPLALGMGNGFGSAPVLDGEFLHKEPVELLKSFEFNKVPVMIGTNKDEGSIFLMTNPEIMALVMASPTNPANPSIDSLNYTHYTKLIAAGLSALGGTSSPGGANNILIDAVHLQYWPNRRDGFPHGAEVMNAVVQASGDFAFTCPTIGWVNLATTFLQSNIPIYHYHFTQRPPSFFGIPMPEWMGVVHGAEMSYVFGQPYAAASGHTQEDKYLSMTMMEYWGNFIKYGDPNIRDGFSTCYDPQLSPTVAPRYCGLRKWPPYFGTDCQYQTFEINTLLQVFNYGDPVTCAFKTRECMFWNELVPKLAEMFKQSHLSN